MLWNALLTQHKQLPTSTHALEFGNLIFETVEEGKEKHSAVQKDIKKSPDR